MADRIPDWLLERLAKGELPAEQAASLRARLEAAGETSRLDALRDSDRALLEAHPPGPALAEIRRRAAAAAPPAREKRLFPKLLVAIPAAAAIAAVALLAVPQGPGTESPFEDGVREKGLAPHLAMYRKSGEQVARLEDGAAAREGDVLQLAYVAAGHAYGAVVSVDGRGAVTLHLPERAGPAARLSPSGEVTLGQAYELDDAPEYERFFLVSSPRPFAAADVVAAAEALARDPVAARAAPLSLPDGLAQASVTVEKVSP